MTKNAERAKDDIRRTPTWRLRMDIIDLKEIEPQLSSPEARHMIWQVRRQLEAWADNLERSKDDA